MLSFELPKPFSLPLPEAELQAVQLTPGLLYLSYASFWEKECASLAKFVPASLWIQFTNSENNLFSSPLQTKLVPSAQGHLHVLVLRGSCPEAAEPLNS